MNMTLTWKDGAAEGKRKGKLKLHIEQDEDVEIDVENDSDGTVKKQLGLAVEKLVRR